MPTCFRFDPSLSRWIAALAIVLKLEADFLTFLKIAHSSSLNCGNVDKNVLAAAVRLKRITWSIMMPLARP